MLTGTRLKVLQLLYLNLPLKEIYLKLGITKAATFKHIRKLIEEGYIERRNNPYTVSKEGLRSLL